MHLHQLKNFMIVYEEKGFAKAVARSRSTQPGLSVQIAALESELNVKLFNRHARGIEPTAAGRQLYLRGLRLLEDANSIVKELQALSGVVTGAVSVGITPGIARAILAPTLAAYVEKYPSVDIRVSEDYSSAMVSLIESGVLDFALLAHIPNHPTIRFKHVYQDRFAVISSVRHDFPPNVPIRLDVAPFHKFIVPSVHHGMQSVLDNPFRTGQIVSSRTIEVNSLMGVLEFVAMTDWLALLPYTSIHYGLDRTKLCINPIAGDDIRIDYYIATASTEPMPAAADAFIEIAARELERINIAMA